MDRRGNSSVPPSNSFYFQLLPSYFKVEHAFAKAMKPNTSYRLAIFKGIQKTDEMAEPLKAKLIGGKILFQPVSLNFSLPIYTPARNIEFTVKVLETKPNESECQIATHKIKSSDFVKKFKDDDTFCSKEEANLLQSFSLVFDLFVHNSKPELEKVVKEHRQKSKVETRGPKSPRRNQFASDISQSDKLSETGSMNKRKISRKRGHDGRLRSRQNSRDNSDAGSEKSGRSSRKSFGPFPHAKKDEHFLHSPKKVSPPKVEDEEGRGKTGRKQNFVTVGRKQNQKSDAKYRGLNPPGTNRPSDSEVNRYDSAKKDRFSRQIGESPSTGKIQTPKSKDEKIHNLMMKTDQNMFSIEQRTREQMKEQASQKPPLANKAVKTKTQENREEQVLPNEPISKPTASREREEEVKGTGEPSSKSKDSKTGYNSIKIKQQPLKEIKGERTNEHMKASVRVHENHKSEEDEQEQAGKEYNGMKDRLFYIVFTIVSVFLFWNALTPSRKV